MPCRIQIVAYQHLIAEAIVENAREADILWSRYSVAKWNKRIPIGGAIMQRADLPRYWNVPVGHILSE